MTTRLSISLLLLIFPVISSFAKDDPPEGALSADQVIPPSGTVVETMTKSNSGYTPLMFTIIDDGSEYKGIRVIRYEAGGGVELLNAENRNSVAVVSKYSKPQSEHVPDSGRYNWPLWVGKKWKAKYKFINHKTGKSWSPVIDKYKVVGHEEITVPAGTFKTFLIESNPSRNSAVKRKIWYAYEVGLQVKYILERTSRHSDGPSTSETVTTSIRMPN